MENRRTIIAVLLLLPLLLLWTPITNYVFKELGYDVTPRQITEPAVPGGQGDPSSQASTSQAVQAVAVGGTTQGISAGPLHVVPAETSTAASLGSEQEKDKAYKMGIKVSARGAGLDQVVLNEFKKEARGKEPYSFQTPYPNAEYTRPLATRSVTVDGTTLNLGDATWTLLEASPGSATYTLTIADGSGPVLRINKTYRLSQPTDPSEGYELAVDHALTNPSGKDLKVSITVNGPTEPPRESDRAGDRTILAGYVVDGKRIEFTHEGIEAFTKDKPTRDLTRDRDGNPVVWTGSNSSYFNALLRPLPEDAASSPATYIGNVTATLLNPDAKSEDHDIATTLSTTDLDIAANSSRTVPMRAFFGPRMRSLLKNPYFISFPLSYDKTLVLTAGPCGFCTFQWLIDVLVFLLNWFHYILFKDWGLAIIGLVVLVRVILHPVTKRSQISMSRMSKMGPEMQRLKEKHGDNKDELNKAMMGFYKEQGVTPILGCLPMLLQMPIWIALWQALQTTFQLRQAPFLHFFGIPLTWIYDLSKPDHLIEFSGSFQFLFLYISGLNILPILMGVVFYLQLKMQPKPAAMTKEQEQQQRMMAWMMPFIFPLMLYSGPSGLNLYILTSTAIGIVESKIVRDHIKQKEEEENAGRVIVDAGKKFKSGGGSGGGGRKPDQAKKPRSGIAGWL